MWKYSSRLELLWVDVQAEAIKWIANQLQMDEIHAMNGLCRWEWKGKPCDRFRLTGSQDNIPEMYPDSF